MATEKGIVTKVFPSYVMVKATRSESCDSCASRDACHMLGGEGNQVEIETLNPVNAREGDEVLFSIKTASIIKLALLLYILPVIFLFAGAVTGEKIAGFLPYDPSVVTALSGFSFLIFSLILVIFAGRHLEKKRDYRPQIIRILKPGKRDF